MTAVIHEIVTFNLYQYSDTPTRELSHNLYQISIQSITSHNHKHNIIAFSDFHNILLVGRKCVIMSVSFYILHSKVYLELNVITAKCFKYVI